MALAIVLGLLVIVLAYFAWRFSTNATRLRTRYANIIDAEATVAAAKRDLERLQLEQQAFTAQDQQRRASLSAEYDQAFASYKSLKSELALVEEGLNDVSFGLYKPHFDFQTPEEFKTSLVSLRERERALIHDGKAAVCPLNWTVGDSRKEGERMVKQTIKLVLRAFNGECEAARADVSWNNMGKMVERINKSCEAVNKLSGVLQVTITSEYLDLKLSELRLTHEYEECK